MASTEPIVSGYSHIAIVCTDLGAARAFYCGLFGFEELPRPDFGVPGMWLRVGNLQLHFLESETMPIPGPGFPHAVPFLSEPSERSDFGAPVRATFVLDPSGNVIELTDVGPLA